MLSRRIANSVKTSVAASVTQQPSTTVFSVFAQQSRGMIAGGHKNTDESKVHQQALVHEISLRQMECVQTVVPWFMNTMPASYFRQVPEALQKSHIKAAASMCDLKQNDLSLRIDEKVESGHEVTVISTHTNPALLLSQLNSIVPPSDSNLSKVRVYNSNDGELQLNMFSYTSMGEGQSKVTDADASRILAFVGSMRDGSAYKAGVDVPPLVEEIHNKEYLQEYFKNCTSSYVRESNPRRFLIQMNMYNEVKSTEGTSVHIEPHHGEDAAWISVAAANVLPDVLLRLTAGVLSPRNLTIQRAHLDQVADPSNNIPANGNTPEVRGSVTMVRVLVSPSPLSKSTSALSVEENLKAIVRDVKRAKWLDPATTTLGLVDFPEMGVERAEVITALTTMLHCPLFKMMPDAFSGAKSALRLVEHSAQTRDIACAIADAFIERFNPKNKGQMAAAEDKYNATRAAILARISTMRKDGSRLLLEKMVEAVDKTKRTNFFFPDRYSLSFRMDPTIMFTPEEMANNKARPYGMYFSHGRHFNGFHNRFRDIARGGLRIVTPQNADAHSLESTRQFDEVYGLSFAQQLKNKDIPEGGAKGVVLVNSPVIPAPQRNFAVRKSIKAFTDSILDLMVEDENFVTHTVDHLGKSELVYLGPDEQIVSGDIDWIIQRAEQRGYPIPAAFMSSKKGAGINHKEYGVTSEGVAVFLDVALRNVLNINPDAQPFTVKITGGPDGDVAGNLMKILFRDYGKNAKVVGVADGSGVAEDPAGLDADELMRLFEAGEPIASFNRAKLSPQGIMMEANTDEGRQRRDSMHFRVKADAFVPAGGRPNSTNKDNWMQFLDENGQPSSRLVVEGANIFHTPEAREKLFTKGVTIVKDSSANKCGVVTSSCEIAASMLISKDEFMSIKQELVSDVLVKLRHIAEAEAELLFREYRNYPGHLPHFSERISYAIGACKDAICDHMAQYKPGDPEFEELMPLVKASLPKKLQDFAWDRHDRFPVQYMRNAMGSTLGASLVYQEGIHFVEAQPKEKLAERAIAYYRASLDVERRAHELEKAGADAETIRLLRKGGARSKLNIF
jgi:glutamate dehydrogenase